MSWESWAVHPSIPEVLQMPKIGTPQESLQKMTDKCQMWGGKDWDRMEEDSLKEIRCANCQQDHPAYARFCDIYKKTKRNTWGETQEECVLPGSKENSRDLHWGKTALLLLHRRRIQSIKTTNIELSWRNWFSWKRMIGQGFRSISRPNFTKCQLNNKLRIKKTQWGSLSKQMTYIELLLLHGNSQSHLITCKQMIKSK